MDAQFLKSKSTHNASTHFFFSGALAVHCVDRETWCHVLFFILSIKYSISFGRNMFHLRQFKQSNRNYNSHGLLLLVSELRIIQILWFVTAHSRIGTALFTSTDFLLPFHCLSKLSKKLLLLHHQKWFFRNDVILVSKLLNKNTVQAKPFPLTINCFYLDKLNLKIA